LATLPAFRICLAIEPATPLNVSAYSQEIVSTMRIRFHHLLLLIALGIAIALIFWDWRGLDADFAEKLLDAERVRHDYVISHDFAMLKENLVSLHHDHWAMQKAVQDGRKARLGIVTLLALILIVSLVKAFFVPRKAQNEGQ
jgi:hypothetical protein